MGKILVTGASGYVGRKTLLHLLNRTSADRLIGLVRDPSKAQDLNALGIELRQGDYLDPASLAPALRNVEKLMLVSAHAFTDRITAHGNVIDAAIRADVQHVVYMPIFRKPNSTLSMKEITQEDLFTEEKLSLSGLNYTLAKHPPFLDFLATYIGRKAHETGIQIPAGIGRFNAVSRDDLAEAHAAILTGKGHENKSYALTGDPAISFSDIAAMLSGITGKSVPCINVSDEEYVNIRIADGWPDFVATFALGWVKGMNAGEWDGQTPDLETLLGRKARTPVDFFRKDYLPH